MEQYLHRAETNDGGASFENLKSMASTLDESDTNPSVGFDCNICLDLVQDPVVTFCGHLYCWPCIYRWISFRDNNPDYQSHPQCPVCKTEVSEKTLIPLYGRGHSSKRKLSHLIPHRPSSPRSDDNALLPNSPSYPFQQREDHAGGYRINHLADPMIGMFGEMVYARIFGNSETTLYTYPNSYRLAGSNTPRLRRYMMQTDKSLSRVCFFLFCCMILCLLLF